MSGIEILVGDNRGQYIPQFFAEYCSDKWDGIHPDDMQVLLDGPDNEWYWETWDSVHTTAKHVDKNGNTWYLYQDGDLFAICEELMTDEERENFGFSDH